MNTEENKQDNKNAGKVDMFENNPDTFSEGEQMNRDYLVHLYNEDMSFLNKEIRMTRSGYIKDVFRYRKLLSKQEKGNDKAADTDGHNVCYCDCACDFFASGVKGIHCPYGFVDVWGFKKIGGLYRWNIFGLFKGDIPLNEHNTNSLCCENDKNIKEI